MAKNCIMIIPTINLLSERDSMRKYLDQMDKEKCLMPVCVVDDSKEETRSKNREYLKNIDSNHGVYHFSKIEQERFYKELGKNGIEDKYIKMLKTVPSYGAARNKCFLAARILDAKKIFFFDDDTEPVCDIFRRHLKILDMKKNSKKIALVSGPYIGARGIDFAFLDKKQDKMKFLRAIDHHGKSSLEFLKKGGRPPEPLKKEHEIQKKDLRSVSNIRGGNALIGEVYRKIVCPTIKQAPGIDDTFVSHQVSDMGYSVVKSPVPVAHSHLEFRKKEDSIMRYVESWAKPLAFELLYQGETKEMAKKRVIEYGKNLNKIDNSLCKNVGEKLVDLKYAGEFVERIIAGIKDYKLLKNVWGDITKVCDSFEVNPVP